MKNKILFVFVLMLLFSFAFWENNAFVRPDNLNYVPWEVIVKYKDSNQTKWLRSVKSNDLSLFSDNLELNSLEVKEELNDSLNIALIEIKDEKSVEEVIKFLEQDPNVEYAEPNYIRYFFSNVCSVSSNENDQWWLDFMDWEDAYNIYSWFLSKSEWVVVWVADNWVNYYNSALKNSMWNTDKCIVDGKTLEWCNHWYDFYHNTKNPLPNWWFGGWHWTHVAGIIAANTGNIIWVNPYAKIAALKIGRGRQLSISDEIRAIQFAIDNNIKIINASFWATWYVSIGEKLAIQDFWNHWWLFVAAAGNEWDDVDVLEKVYPCSYDLDNIICVASIDRDWSISSFSNHWNVSVDIAAPWWGICSTFSSSSIDYNIKGSQFFSSCVNEGQGITSWIGWVCRKWSNIDDFWYYFNNSLESPWVDLTNITDDLYVSFSISCNQENIGIYYNGDLQDTIEYDWFNQFISIIPDVYRTNDFKLKLEKSGNWWCIIDDFEIYTDPYVQDKDRYDYMDWTSMATPHVVWLASLVWTISPELSYTGVRNLIIENGSGLTSLVWKTVSWKVINVKKTLDAAAKRSIPLVTWLQSSWTGNIKWDALDWVDKYYFEVFTWDIIVKTWFVVNEVSTWLDLTWNYTWRVQWLDELWNKSDFSTWYICQKPILTENNLIWIFSWYECSTLVWNMNYNDNCSNSYEIVWDNGTWTVIFNWAWNINKEVFIRNQFWEESNHLNVYYTWFDSLPTINKSSYTHLSSITSTSQQNLGNIVSILWVKDWVCGEDSISIVSVSCSEWQWSFSSKNLLITAPSNKQWSENCTIIFKDDESNLITWNLNYTFNTIQTQVNNWWWGGWWGWWGGWWGWWGSNYSCKKLPSNAVVNNNLTPKSNTNYSYSTDTSEVCTFQCKSGYIWNKKDNTCDKLVENKDNTWNIVKLEENEDNIWKSDGEFFEKPKNLELFDNNVTNNIFDFSRFNNQNPTSVLLNWYTVEFNNAYEFARRAWITTTDSIEKANMNWSLTRIAMAKMLSNYAMNILWKVPSNSIVPKFPDVSQKMDDDYWWAVSLAYQLWIMWKWINKFRPNDIVSRAEFWTALSRMLYWTPDWEWNYYSTHLDKLHKEWVISNTNPNLKELRWYVMIMLMRSAKD